MRGSWFDGMLIIVGEKDNVECLFAATANHRVGLESLRKRLEIGGVGKITNDADDILKYPLMIRLPGSILRRCRLGFRRVLTVGSEELGVDLTALHLGLSFE